MENQSNMLKELLALLPIQKEESFLVLCDSHESLEKAFEALLEDITEGTMIPSDGALELMRIGFYCGAAVMRMREAFDHEKLSSGDNVHIVCMAEHEERDFSGIPLAVDRALLRLAEHNLAKKAKRDGSSPSEEYMVSTNGAAVFMKTKEFFLDQGGDKQPWGKHWVEVRAKDIEDARSKGRTFFIQKGKLHE